MPGGTACAPPATTRRWSAPIAELARRARRVVSVCSGAFLLAAAGLLDGRRVTTHWARAGGLAADHPDVDVDPDPIWIRDGNVWTSAGVTAGIDVALALVEDDHGVEVAETVARWLVMFLRRPGGQSQFAAPVWRPAGARRADAPGPGADRDRPGRRPPPAACSPARSPSASATCCAAFTAEVGDHPGPLRRTSRVEAARRELESSDDTVAAIAARVGFGTAESMRRTFVRDLGAAPDDYRRRFSQPPDRTIAS